MLIREVEKPIIKDFFLGLLVKNNKLKVTNELLSNTKLIGSGKGAIALVLEYLKQKKILANKLDEILVPDWLGFWVYNQMQPWVFPVKRISEKTKIIFVYHQYGFPQDMDKILEFAQDKKLIVIEDCAHAIASEYKGKKLGAFGDFAVYSFSKWFFCFALGGASSKSEDFNNFLDRSVAQTPWGLTVFKDKIKFIDEWISFSGGKSLKRYSNLFLNMSYAIYGQALKPSRLAVNLLKLKLENEIKIRQKRYEYFLKQTKNLGICDHLERQGITPYVIPIRPPEAKIKSLIIALRNKSVNTGQYFFDINRNLLSPRYVPVVWLPCHHGITDKIFSDITDEVIKIIK